MIVDSRVCISLKMSGPEIKHALRKVDFPLCAREALTKIGQLTCGRVANIKTMDIALDLMAEFVFCEVDRRGNKRTTPLNSLIELQLLEVLLDYFNSALSEASRNCVFLSLFSGTVAMLRSGVLSKLISVAIGIPSQSVLISASAWMQQLGNTSTNCCKLAETIVRDYFVLVPGVTQKLNVLPHIAPQFTANFLTAVGEIYFSDERGSLNFPPQSLLETITLWVNENHKLCIAAQQNPSALPLGAIPMETTTPIAGLLKWCVLAPFYHRNTELYAKLHLALLNSLLEIPSVFPPRAVSARHLAIPIGYICRYVLELQMQAKKESTGIDKAKSLLEDGDLQLALDRYSQAIQVALSVNCVYGNIDELLNQLLQLPQNKLLSIVVHTNKQNK